MKYKNTKDKPAGPHPQYRKAASSEEAKIIQLITFNLGDEEYGADINEIREIIRTGAITPIPDSLDFIKGIANVRGEIPVVIDLKARFALPPARREVRDKHLVITEQEKNIFALLVDEVTEVLRIPETEIKPAPELITRIEREYVKGVIPLDNRLIILLSLHEILSEEQLARLTEFAHNYGTAKLRYKAKAESQPAAGPDESHAATRTIKSNKRCEKPPSAAEAMIPETAAFDQPGGKS